MEVWINTTKEGIQLSVKVTWGGIRGINIEELKNTFDMNIEEIFKEHKKKILENNNNSNNIWVINDFFNITKRQIEEEILHNRNMSKWFLLLLLSRCHKTLKRNICDNIKNIINEEINTYTNQIKIYRGMYPNAKKHIETKLLNTKNIEELIKSYYNDFDDMIGSENIQTAISMILTEKEIYKNGDDQILLAEQRAIEWILFRIKNTKSDIKNYLYSIRKQEFEKSHNDRKSRNDKQQKVTIKNDIKTKETTDKDINSVQESLPENISDFIEEIRRFTGKTIDEKLKIKLLKLMNKGGIDINIINTAPKDELNMTLKSEDIKEILLQRAEDFGVPIYQTKKT